MHKWDVNAKQAVAIQKKLRQRIRLCPFKIKPNLLVAGADVSFTQDRAIGAVIALGLPDFKIIKQVKKSRKIKFPYVTGLLTFREGPVLEECFKSIKIEPDVILFDGQGITHPRSMGLATHMGILLDKPTIGCAKTHLFGDYQEPKTKRGCFSYVLDKKGQRIGAVLRTKDFIKPIFVSPGNKIDIESAIKIVLMCTPKYRLPEPLRIAHQIAGEKYKYA